MASLWRKNSIRIYGAAHSANLRDSLSFGGSHHQSEQLGPCLKAPKASAASPRVRKPALGRGMAGTRPPDGMTNLRKEAFAWPWRGDVYHACTSRLDSPA